MPVQLNDVVIDPAQPESTPGLRGVLGIPADIAAGPRPGVVVVHEVFGIDDVMRRQVQRLAAAGYLALMPDLFTAGGVRRCLVATFRALAAGHGRAFADIESARKQLAERPDCTGAVGIIGFCMGGAFALVAANRGFDVASVNYGALPKDLDTALDGACPIVASYGGRDRALRNAPAELATALTRLAIEHDVRQYPDAGHSFLNDGPIGPRVLRPILRVAHVGPEPASAVDAWARIEAFLGEHLQPAESVKPE